MSNAEESLDGSDVESNYSGISNEDFEELDDDVDEPDEKALSAVDEEPGSDAEGDLSRADAKEGFPADANAEEVLSTAAADAEDVFSSGNAEEVLSASDAEDAMSVSDAEDDVLSSDDDEEEVLFESGDGDVMSASDAEDFVPSTNEVLSEDESVGAVADRSPSPDVKEEPMSASDDDRSPSPHIKEESMSEFDPEPPTDYTCDKDFEEVKEESLASDAKLIPATSKGTSGLSEKDILRGSEDAGKHGKLDPSSKREDKVCKTKFTSYGTRPLGRKSSHKPKPRTNNSQTKSAQQLVLPAPYLGPRPSDGKLMHCYFCEYSHRYKSRMMNHLLKHYPPTKFCHLCGKGFHNLDNLNQHLRFHVNLRPYKCRLCDYAGRDLRRIKQHIGRHLKKSLMTSDDASQFYEVDKNMISSGQKAPLSGRSSTSKPKRKNKAKPKKMPPPYTGPRETGSFQCYHCPKASNTKSGLSDHIHKHLPPQYFCHICGNGFTKLGGLWNHISRAHSNEKPFKCHICDFETKYRESLAYHVKRHGQTVAKLSCFHCGWTTDKKCHLAKHIKKEHLKERFNCLLCDYSSNFKNCLRSHYVAHHTSKKAYHCPFCDYQNLSSYILKQHMGTHSDVANSQCPLCSVPITGIDSFSDHMTLRHVDAQSVDQSMLELGKSTVEFIADVGKKPYSCQLCKHRCFTIEDFIVHMSAHSRKKNLKCPHCPYTTYSSTILNEHINGRHTKEKQYACKFCDFKALYKSSLNSHTNIKHTQSRWYKCRFCPFQSPNPGSTTSHELIHVNDKKFACDLCDYRTLRSRALKTHKLIHTGERSFKCDLCDYDAYTRTSIRRHMQVVHTAERRFICAFCRKAFKTQNYLKIHEKMHGGREPIKCSMCTFQTVKDLTLRKHVSEMHLARKTLQDPPDAFPNGRKKRWYPCKKCAYVTCSKPSIKAHVKKRHPNVKI